MDDDVVRPATGDKIFRPITEIPKATDVRSTPKEEFEFR